MRRTQTFAIATILPLALSITACDMSAEDLDSELVGEQDKASSCSSTQGAQVASGLTTHFRQYLNANYPDMDFARDDLAGGSFGGFISSSDCARKQPVIFVHGNSDRALGGTLGGWEDSLEYFEGKGYRSAELFATTYGTGSASDSASYYHSRDNLTQIRSFIEAVLDYTGADKVDVISHSMGVTISRKAIKGGYGHDLLGGGDYNLGAPLTSRIDTFVGIAGGNRGLATCYYTPGVPTCAPTNGFYPGYVFGFSVVGVSDFLEELNSSSRYEGSFRYSIWSSVDEIVGGGCLVWGSNTCRVPGHTAEKKYSSYPYGHIGVRDQTPAVQYQMVANHNVP
ncbi:lipase [Haliangium ochraceum]|uniref:Lipase class 2 n=1 Tax=Haliangium ochraceum (strain DSM 14365 / JCM 11303 / SMP-2) TaxID=502025 RepID=D0LYR8_HALO1|nr:lipase [Haliangium ochraceum]ACY17934.1 lipase class 2 [Haliangium ochraceum DSM 14365]